MPRIEEIVLPESIASDYDAAEPFNTLENIKRLNVFVGPNNSGKSRLMRSIFLGEKQTIISTSDEVARGIRTHSRELSDSCVAIEQMASSTDSNSHAVLQAALPLLSGHPLGFHGLQRHFGSDCPELKVYRSVANDFRSLAERYHFNQPELSEAAKNASIAIEQIASKFRRATELRERLKQSTPTPEPPFASAEFVYIPTLRGMRLGLLNDQNRDMHFAYFDRTYQDYVGDHHRKRAAVKPSLEQARAELSGKSIFTGLDLYDFLVSKLLGSLRDREFVRSYEKYLSETFFRDEDVALIPRKDHDTVNIKIGNEAERPIQKLGDGLQQIIILTLPMFQKTENPLFLFVEEPDLFLHPGYQRAFIDAVFEHKNPDLYVFVTTHSSQFLDITISSDDCSIFRCSKQSTIGDSQEHDPRFSVVNATFGDNELLSHIGVRPSSLMFANCTIWVEGITDRLYYGKFLELLLQEEGQNLIENMHYAFVEYGGGNITHWSFLDENEGMNVERICSRLFLIADRDFGKEERHQKLGESLGKRFLPLKVHEVENLLTPETICSVIREYEKAEIELNHFEQSAYHHRYLGRFIDSKVLKDKTASRRYNLETERAYAGPSGAIKDKVPFCRKAISHIETFDDLSDEAKDVARKLMKFVVDQNR